MTQVHGNFCKAWYWNSSTSHFDGRIVYEKKVGDNIIVTSLWIKREEVVQVD